MSEIFFQGVWRMDWGLGNPNKTAALIATLMIASWSLAYVRRAGFWVALVLFAGLGVALVHTFSRGGLISLAAGVLPLLAWAPRPWPRGRVLAVVAAFWIIVGASVFLKAHERYAQGVTAEDRSISNRVELWSTAPAMIADSPDGWGLSNAGNAYIQWYQPIARTEAYRTLVNSHLTWLVELGWPGRILYLLGWAFAFLVCWPSSRARWRATALGVWVTFAVAAFFSSVAETAVIWIMPGLFLGAAAWQRLFQKDWPTRRQAMIPIGAAALVSVVLLAAGYHRSGIHGKTDTVMLGSPDPGVWICYDQTTMGTLYGKSLRRFIATGKLNSVGFATSASALRQTAGKTLVLGANLPTDLTGVKAAVKECRRLVLLSPRFFPEEIGLGKDDASRVTVYFGDFSQSPSVEAWQAAVDVRLLSGVGDFIPNWADLALTDSSHEQR